MQEKIVLCTFYYRSVTLLSTTLKIRLKGSPNSFLNSFLEIQFVWMFNFYKSRGNITNVNAAKTSTAIPIVRRMAGAALAVVVEKLNDFAPENLAEKWDNVGLLIEPYTKRLVASIVVFIWFLPSLPKEITYV